MFDKKNAIESIVSRRHKDGSTTTAEMQNQRPAVDEKGEIDGRHAAAQDAIAALHEKNPEKFVEAMGNFHDLHMAMRSKESE